MPLALVFALLLTLAFFDPLIFADFIGYRASACSDGTADQCTLSPAQQSSCDRSARRRPTNDLRSGVVLMVMGSLRPLGAFVTLSLGLGFL